MRIVFTRASRSAFIPDGINVFIWELSQSFLNQGHEVYVMSGYSGGRTNVGELFDIDELPKIVALSARIDSKGPVEESMLWLRKATLALHKISPNLTIVNGAVPFSSPGVKAVVCHDLEHWRVLGKRWYSMLLYRTYNAVIPTSTELRQGVLDEFKLNPTKTTVIPVCINVSRYSTLELDAREHALLQVGTWIDKNLATAVNAFRIAAKKDPKIKLYVVGRVWHQTERILESVEARIRKRIFCLGKIGKKQLMSLYSSVKATVVPSTYRVPVISPTVLESIASGTPVIGSSTSISQDLLIDNYDGFRVQPHSTASIAAMILKIMADPEEWNRMSKNALAHARLYDVSLVGKKYIQLYNSLLS